MSPLVLAFFHLLESDVLEIDSPVGVQLLLPLLQESLKHQDLVVSDLGLGVDLRQLSVSDIGVALLRQELLVGAFVVL